MHDFIEHTNHKHSSIFPKLLNPKKGGKTYYNRYKTYLQKQLSKGMNTICIS